MDERLRRATPALLVSSLLALSGCADLGYSARSLWGGMKMLSGRENIAKLAQDESLDPELRERLGLVLDIRDFATEELGLPDNASYRKFKRLDRRYASWVVVAAPELSVAPTTWCFPIAGCVSYRGYFSEEKARDFADGLSEQGYDVSFGGVAAFSTLGWAADPVLDTFVNWPEADLAGLVFHELSHQVVYVKDDTTFNESFATAVELEGVRRWLEHRGDAAAAEEYATRHRRERAVGDLVQATRQALAEVYAADRDDDWKRERKSALIKALRSEYRSLREAWDGDATWDAWFGDGLNNARLASLGAYLELVPAFEGLLRSLDRSLPDFFVAVEAMAELTPEERRSRLAI